MERLPDDVLAMVMQYLAVDELIDCRLVCKRLADLALHPDAWHHRRLSSDDSGVSLCRALKLAPCLAELMVDLELLSSERQTLYTLTTCAVKELWLVVLPGSYALAGLVIRRQEALGRLKLLTLEQRSNKETVRSHSVLLATVATTSGLQKLEMMDVPNGTCFVPSLRISAPEPSLSRFTCNIQPQLESFINYILAVHAATLEEVELDFTDFGPISGYSSTATLLAALPNLRKLKCGPLPGLVAVASSGSLREAALSVSHVPDQDQELARFLRHAVQLRAVTLRYSEYRKPPSKTSHTSGKDLPLLLAWQSGRSLLESLVIEDTIFPQITKAEYLDPLFAVLPELPALHHLELQANLLDRLAGRVTRATAPALRSLELSEATDCGHSYMHNASVKALLTDNPELEILVCTPRYTCFTGTGAKRGCRACYKSYMQLGYFRECHREACDSVTGGTEDDFVRINRTKCSHLFDDVSEENM